MMGKFFLRVIFINIVIMYILGWLMTPFSISVKRGQEMTLREGLLFVWIMLSLVGIFYFLIRLFYHWGTTNFKGHLKKIWFWALFLGTIIYCIGPIVYYIVVYEMKKGIEVK